MSRRDSPVPAPTPSRRRAPGSGTRHVGRGGEPVPAASGPRRLLVACSLAVSAAPGTLTVYTAVVLATGAVPVVAAWFTKLMVDELSAGAGAEGTAGRLPALAVGLALVGALAAVSPHLAQYLRAQLNRRVGLLAMDRLFTAVERFTGLRHFENPRFFDRLRLAQQAGRVSPNETVDGALGAARAAVTMTGFLGALFTLSPPMTGLVLVSGIPLLTAEIAMSRRRARTLWAIGFDSRQAGYFSADRVMGIVIRSLPPVPPRVTGQGPG